MITTTEKRITVKEFFEMELEEGFFYELINGNIVKKSAPSPKHQDAAFNAAKVIDNYARKKQLGKCYIAPLDVFFDDYNNTQPDILFVRKDREFLITNNGVEGAPDLIVEVLSPSTFRTDRKDKMEVYCQFGVAEYWIIDPKNQSVEVYVLENDRYEMQSFAIETGKIESKVLTGLKMDISKIF